MSICRQISVLTRLRGHPSFSTCSTLLINQKWRKSKGLPEQPNLTHELLSLPDYSFLDGRPTPYGTGQKRRIEKQKEYTARIVKLSSEIDLALQLHKKREEEKQAAINERISRKLTEKGNISLDN